MTDEKKQQGPVCKVERMTFSRLSRFTSCPQAEYYSYRVKGVGVTGTTPYLPYIEGEFGHYALKHFYRSGLMLRANLLKRLEKILDRLRAEGGLAKEDDDRIHVAMVALMGACMGYRDKYKRDLQTNELVSAEQKFDFEFEGLRFVGKIDRASRDKKTGELMLWENKFVGSISPDTYSSLPLSAQDLIYSLALKKILGESPKWRCRDYIQKSRLRRKQSEKTTESLLEYETRVYQQYVEEPDKMFWRPPPAIMEEVVLKAAEENLKRLIRAWRAAGEDPYMSWDCLGMYGQACAFIPACIAKMSGHHDGWNAPECRGLFKLKTAQFPELEEEDDE